MSQSSNELDLLRLEVARLLAQLPQSGSKDEALGIAIKAAETSMRALSIVKDKAERELTTTQVKALMTKAERIKQSTDWKLEVQPSKTTLACGSAKTDNSSPYKLLTEPRNCRTLSKSELKIVLKGGFLNGVKFPEWINPPPTEEFELKDGESLFFDEASELALSDFQLDVLDDWKRPQDALPPPTWLPEVSRDDGPVMDHVRDIDLVQDAATDCSVVASLCAILARYRRGFPRILQDAFFPRHLRTKLPIQSDNGKYILRMNFNGCQRRVIIDDRIPTSMSSRIIHVVDRNNPGWMWPALVEKAYLKVRGGYDFPGSNSGTDLWVLTGWIPEQVFLQSDELEPERCWKRILNAFLYGDVLITLGTGKMTDKTEKALGLAGEHDYAVLDLREVDGQRLMLVKNPWSQGPSWRGRFKRTNQPGEKVTDDANRTETDDFGDDVEPVASPRDLLNVDDQLSPGTFWMDLDNVLQHFESMYLNWNTGLFSYRQDTHFQWDLSELPGISSAKSRGPYASLQDHPQFSVTAEKGGTIWILLWRHFQNCVPENATDEEIESGRQHIDLTGHISVIAFASGGRRVMLPEGHLGKAWYVDSPQTLLKLESCDAGKPYTVAPLEQELAPTNQTFTISAFSNSPLTLAPASPRYPYQSCLTATWTKDSAGGNAQHSTYCDNPQFSISVSNRSKISILLESSNCELNVHVKLVHSSGKRVHRIRNKDIITDSRDYRRGCCVAESDALESGKYTIICSTFEPNQLGDFTLLVESSQQALTLLLPREGAGLVRTELPTVFFGSGENRLAIPLTPKRLINVYVVARRLGDPHSSSGRSHMRLSIEFGRGPEVHTITVSNGGEYVDVSNAHGGGTVRTEAVDLLGARELRRLYNTEEYWVVLDRMSAGGAGSHGIDERFVVELLADQTDGVEWGSWRGLED